MSVPSLRLPFLVNFESKQNKCASKYPTWKPSARRGSREQLLQGQSMLPFSPFTVHEKCSGTGCHPTACDTNAFFCLPDTLVTWSFLHFKKETKRDEKKSRSLISFCTGGWFEMKSSENKVEYLQPFWYLAWANDSWFSCYSNTMITLPSPDKSNTASQDKTTHLS